MIKDKRNIVIMILAIIGFCLAIELAYIYYNANYNDYGLMSFCSINDYIDCDGVAKSVHSQFLGIPLAYWGIFFYMTVLFLTVVEKLKNIRFLKFLEVFKNPNDYITFLGTIAFTVSMVLAGMSLYVIKKICILCVFTYIIDLIIALIACGGKFKNIVSAFKTTAIDFVDGAKKYTKTFIVLMLVSCSFLTYSGVTLKFVPKVKRAKSIIKYQKIKYNPYRAKGNTLGNPQGNVVIELYSDYVCPLCYINNIMLHQAVKEFDNVYVIHKNYPFDKECNSYMMINIHPNACFMSKGALAAKKQGNYWEMSSLLYENQPKKMEDMLKLADKLGFDKNKFAEDFSSREVQNELEADIKDGAKKEIDATPTMYINGEKYIGVKPYYELKEILIKHGAKKQ